MRRFLLCGFALCLVCAAPLSGVAGGGEPSELVQEKPVPPLRFPRKFLGRWEFHGSRAVPESMTIYRSGKMVRNVIPPLPEAEKIYRTRIFRIEDGPTFLIGFESTERDIGRDGEFLGPSSEPFRAKGYAVIRFEEEWNGRGMFFRFMDTHCTLVEDQLERLSNEELGALFDIGHCEDQYSRFTPFHRP